MYKDPTGFKQRFLMYKNGEKPYENGLPKYATGTVPKNKFDAFVEKMGPYLYSSLKKAGVKNIEGAYRNMMRQLALESSYGLSQQAVKYNNFGGVGYNGSTYHKYKSHQDFIDAYVRLMTTKYADSLLLNDPKQYAKAVYDKGYYRSEENTPKANAELLAKYQRDMSNMPSLNSALESHIKNNPNLYNSSFIRQSAQNAADVAMRIYSAQQPRINGGNAPLAITENTDNGKVMHIYWGDEDLRYNQPQWMPKEPRAVDYSIGERAPESISSWNNAEAPKENVHMPDIKLYNDLNRALFDVFGWNNNSKKKFGLPPLKSLLPSLDDMLQEQSEDYMRAILGVPLIKPLSAFKKGKLPKFNTGNNPMNYQYDGTIYDPELKNEGIDWAVDIPLVTVTGKDKRPIYQKYDAYNSTNFDYIKNLAKNIAHKSGGDYGIDGLIWGAYGVMLGMDKPYIGDYNGTTTLRRLYDDLRPVDKKHDVIDMLFSNTDGGFLKYAGPLIVINKKPFGNKKDYYSYPIVPMDTLYFPNWSKLAIDSIAKTKNVYSFNIDNGPIGIRPLIKEKEWDRPIIDVKNASMSLQPNYIKFFDLWDNGGGILGGLYNRFVRRPVFVHDVPYKFGNYSNRDLRFLLNVINLEEDAVHNDMREFKLDETLGNLLMGHEYDNVITE